MGVGGTRAVWEAVVAAVVDYARPSTGGSGYGPGTVP
jgi:hypothetical protein